VAGSRHRAIVIAQASGGKTNDNFTIPGTESQNASNVLSQKLPAFSGGQTTVVFATTNGSGKITDPADKAAIDSALTELKSVPQVSNVVDPYTGKLVSKDGEVGLAQVQWSAKAIDVKGSSLDASSRDETGAGRGRAGRVHGSVSRTGTCSPPNCPN